NLSGSGCRFHLCHVVLEVIARAPHRAGIGTWVDSKSGVPVRIQYAAALNHWVSLGVVSYSGWVSRSHRDRTRLTVRPRPTTRSRSRVHWRRRLTILADRTSKGSAY